MFLLKFVDALQGFFIVGGNIIGSRGIGLDFLNDHQGKVSGNALHGNGIDSQVDAFGLAVGFDGRLATDTVFIRVGCEIDFDMCNG